jgi:hypothetical protein
LICFREFSRRVLTRTVETTGVSADHGVHQLGNFVSISSSFFANRSFGTACSERGYKPNYGPTNREVLSGGARLAAHQKLDLCPNLLDPKTRRGVISNNV